DARGRATFAGAGRDRSSRHAERRRSPSTTPRPPLVSLQAGRAPLLLRTANASRRARSRRSPVGGLAALGVVSHVHLLLQPHALLRTGSIRSSRVARPPAPVRAICVQGPGWRDGSLGHTHNARPISTSTQTA